MTIRTDIIHNIEGTRWTFFVYVAGSGGRVRLPLAVIEKKTKATGIDAMRKQVLDAEQTAANMQLNDAQAADFMRKVLND